MGLTTTGRDLHADVRAVYLHAFDVFAADVNDLAGVIGSGTRRAREIADLLTSKAPSYFVESTTDAGRFWQTYNTYDSHTREQAETEFDELVWPLVSATPAPAAKATPTGTACLCGCGAATGKKSLYRPGHDARHAGMVARGEKAMDTLPTQALKDKAAAIIAGRRAKAAPVVEEGTVKVGRWTYGATREGSTVTYRLKDAREVRVATEKQALTFQPNS